jgi:hypothetical protein
MSNNCKKQSYYLSTVDGYETLFKERGKHFNHFAISNTLFYYYSENGVIRRDLVENCTCKQRHYLGEFDTTKSGDYTKIIVDIIKTVGNIDIEDIDRKYLDKKEEKGQTTDRYYYHCVIC